MTDLLTKANRVIAACERMLEVCAKATAEPWTTASESGSGNPLVLPGHGERCFALFKRADAAFIAQARTMTEPALRSTVIALKALMAHKPEDYSYMMHPFAWTKVALAAMLDTWPDTI